MARVLPDEVRARVLAHVLETYTFMKEEDVVTVYMGERWIHVYAHHSGSAYNLEFDPLLFEQEDVGQV